MSALNDIKRKIDRYKRLYSSKQNGGILVTTSFSTDSLYNAANLNSFDFTNIEEHKSYWDILIENQRNKNKSLEGFDDDSIPGITLHYGFGAFGMVFCDAKIAFTEDTSYIHPVIEDWSRSLDSLYNKDRFWSKVFIEAGRYISNKANGEFFIDPYPSPSPLDVANLLRGNDIFTDYYEYPDELKRLLDLAVPAITENITNIQNAIYNPHGGSLAFGKWIPKGTVLLEDAADLSSPSQYLEFGSPYTTRVINTLGGAYIHHHSLAPHQYKNIASLPLVTVEQISSDPNAKRPATDLDFILSQVGSTVTDLECTPEEVYTYIEKFKQGRFILTVTCADRKEANEVLEFVRANSIIQ